MKISGTLMVFLLVNFTSIRQATAQCGSKCQDRYLWCPSQASRCAILKRFCRKTCNACLQTNPACTNCTQRYILSNNETEATCGCFDGYELDSDGRTCNVISPDPPSNLTTMNAKITSIEISYDAVENATSYEIIVTCGGTTYSQTTDQTSYAFTGLQSISTCSLEVRAVVEA